jgi:hypothetical protein
MALLVTITGSTGCAHTLKETAKETVKEAAPAAIAASVKETEKPQTRDRIAEVLKDRDIRDGVAGLSASVVDGALDSMSQEQRAAHLNAIADGLVTSVAAALARSWRAQLGPEFSRSMAAAVDSSVNRALDANTEQRASAIAEAVATGTVKGFGRAMSDDSGKLNPELVAAFGDLARGMTHEVAFGFRDAVADARLQHDRGAPPQGDVLGLVGKAADTSFWALPLVFWGALALGFGVAVAIGWMIFELIRLRRVSSELRLQARGV